MHINNIVFTKREEDLMDFLWQQPEPLTAYDMSEKGGWSVNYLRVLVKLLEKRACCAAAGWSLTAGNTPANSAWP